MLQFVSNLKAILTIIALLPGSVDLLDPKLKVDQLPTDMVLGEVRPEDVEAKDP